MLLPKRFRIGSRNKNDIHFVTVATSVQPPASDALHKKRKRREFIEKIAYTLLLIVPTLTIQYQTALLGKAKMAEQAQQELKAIALAAQQFHKEHNRWPRNIFELRNDPKLPFIAR